MPVSLSEPEGNDLLLTITNKNTQEVKKYVIKLYNNIVMFNCNFEKHLIDVILTHINKYISSNNLSAWAYIQLDDEMLNENLLKLVEYGYAHPYISSVSPSNMEIYDSICLSQKNDQTDSNLTIYQIEYVLEMYDSDTCFMQVKLDSDTIEFLESTTRKGWSRNKNGGTTQKEMSGNLSVVGMEKNDDSPIHILHLDQDSIILGEEESVSVPNSKYNFHSHPHQAYEKNRVDKAWPSLTDYLGYIHLGSSTIFHLVTTIEGLYIICFGKYWSDKLPSFCGSKTKIQKSIIKFLKKNYDIDRHTDMTPEECVKHVNNILYKGYPIFILQYHQWKDADKIFNIYYAKDDGNCFSCQSTHDIFNEHYNKHETKHKEKFNKHSHKHSS